jgi:NitT/TauT family transport system permease protein
MTGCIMHHKNKFGKAVAVMFALLLWQIAAVAVDQKILLVSPIEVAARMTSIWQVEGFTSSIWYSFYHIAGGFLLALILGVLLAALSGRFPWIETALWPFMITVKTVPVASFVVICLIWLSAQNLSVFISFLIVLPVVYGNVLEGIKSEDQKMLEVGRVFDMPIIKRIAYIHMPQLKPFMLSACKTSLGMSWKAGIAAEIIGTPDGSIGKQLYYAKIYLDTDDLLCWTVIIVIISVMFEKLFMFLLKRLYRGLERA